jgi:cytochrome c oxidase assembly protein subunit 15
MEWGHRVLGRVIGVAFVGPLAYFALRKQLTKSLPTELTALAALIGVQGLLGWYMVKSGLQDSLLDTPGAVPRVSQYRLAAHLGTAFVLYAGMFSTGLAVIKDWRFAHTGRWNGLDGHLWHETLKNPLVRQFRNHARLLTALVFLTALSGMLHCALCLLRPDLIISFRSFCRWSGRRTRLQRISAHGRPCRSPSRRAIFFLVL